MKVVIWCIFWCNSGLSLVLRRLRRHTIPGQSTCRLREDSSTFIQFYCCVCLSTCLLVGSELHASNRTESELKELANKISVLQSSLNTSSQQKNDVAEEIQQIEKKIHVLTVRSQENQQLLRISKENQTDLLEKQVELDSTLIESRNELVKLIRTSYLQGRESSVKVLLSQQDPATLSRSLSILGYLSRQKKQKIQQLTLARTQSDENQAALQSEQNKLELLQTQLDKDASELESASSNRQSKLAEIQKSIDEGSQQIDQYEKREAELTQLLLTLKRKQALNKVEQQPVETPVAQEQVKGDVQGDVQLSGGFRKNRGQLPSPVRAQLRARFGEKKPESGLKWEGVMFDSDAGKQVASIFSGQVVYSDWFRGFGQLVVVDHGEGYMSLYGHNSQLQSKLGDRVEAGHTIALSGATGGLESPGVYFEIRYNGEPSDPQKWCRI